MKKCLLVFYSGTNNTTYLTDLVKKRLEVFYTIDVYRINPLSIESLDLSPYDLIGIGYPIYGFNLPVVVDKFIRKQKFIKNQRVFIYKNSGETYSLNNSSSLLIKQKVKKYKAILTNEYHFMMPYNIHFRYDEYLVKEMLEMDNLLLDIMAEEINKNIPNIKRNSFINTIIHYLFRLTYIGGNINVLFYKIKQDKCIHCNKCIYNCQMNNIYQDKNGDIKFHSRCIMCMNCTLNCPKDAIRMGLFDSWRVNGAYDFDKINNLKMDKPYINQNTKGFFKCYVKTYKEIKNRHHELFKN